MGLFLAMSGVVGVDANRATSCLEQYAKACKGSMKLRQTNVGGRKDLVISEAEGNCVVIYPSGFANWDDASWYLSDQLRCPVFSLHVHDGDLWMLLLFKNGTLITRFNPVPDYWGEELSGEDRLKWAGNPESIAACVAGSSPDEFRPYLISWDEKAVESGSLGKAHADDQFAAGDCWQVVDFMRRARLPYPGGADGRAIGKVFSFQTNKLLNPNVAG